MLQYRAEIFANPQECDMTPHPLKEIPIFADLTERELELLTSVCCLVEGEPGHCMLRQGEAVESIYFLLAGQAAITKNVAGDDPVVIAYVGKGAILGELSILDNYPASATITTTEQFKALVIDRNEFLKVLDNDITMGHKVFKRIAWMTGIRLRMTSGKLAQYMSHPLLSA